MKPKKCINNVDKTVNLFWTINRHIPRTWDYLFQYFCLVYICHSIARHMEVKRTLPTDAMINKWVNEYKVKKNLS